MFGITSDVCGIGTDEFVKRIDSSNVVEDCGHYYVVEFDLNKLVIVNPPLKPGFPGLGLSLWKYGKLGLIMNPIVSEGFKQTRAIKSLKQAMEGDYVSECRVLGVKMPQEGDDSFKSSFNFPIPNVKNGKFFWSNPKDKQSWASMWKRFYKYLLNNILRIEVDGVKSIVASCSVVLDAYEYAYHAQHDGQIAFAILPDVPVRTGAGKITMDEAVEDTTKGFIMLKNPASSVRQFITLTPVGCKSMLNFLVTGEVKLYEHDEPVLCGKGAVIISSDSMQARMCVQDFDGDQPVLLYVDAECCPPVQAPIDWVKEFVTKDSKAKINLATEQEKLEYYADLMLTIVAARQAIAPMVLGSLAGYIEMVIRAFNDKRLAMFPVSGWDKIQCLLSAVAEIYAIKKEKSMADSADKKTGWLWVDMFLELYSEGKNMIPVRRRSTVGEIRRSGIIRSLIRPNGETIQENEQTGEIETVSSVEPFDIMKTLVKNAKTGIGLPEEIKAYFPSLYLTTQFYDVKTQMKRRQFISTKATKLSEMTSDVQVQHYILSRALDCYLHNKGLTKMSGVFITMDNAAREFVAEIRAGIRDVMDEYYEDDSIERLEMIRESQATAVEIMVEEGLCEANEEAPWVPGQSLNSDNEYLFALCVATRDMHFTSREGYEGERVVEDGRKSSFNKCTPEGIRRCINGYLGVIGGLTVDEVYGNGDMTPIHALPGFAMPYWVGDEDIDVNECAGCDIQHTVIL